MDLARDEYRHEGVAEEVWAFDLWDPSTGVGVVARLTYVVASSVAWWWAGAVGLGPPLVALRVPDAPLPRRGTTVRTDGLWVSVEPWAVSMECFAVAYDDPWEAARSERGDVVPFGLELSFDGSSPPVGLEGGYEQRCSVEGTVLLADRSVEVSCVGTRAHVWGAGGLPSPYARVQGAVGDVVGVCPFLVPGGVWVEELHTGGWVGRLDARGARFGE